MIACQRKRNNKIAILMLMILSIQILVPILPMKVLAVEEGQEISRNYEIKEEEIWEISKNQDGSVMAKWTRNDKTLTISGQGKMKDNLSDSISLYTNLIEKVEIQQGVTSIGNATFEGCSGLTSITIPESVTSIGWDCFEGCNSLEKIIVSTNNKTYSSENGILFNKDKTTLIKYPAGNKERNQYDIPNNVTSIRWNAFEDCRSLTNITIPESVTSIGSNTFSGCRSLTNITIPENVTSIERYTFSGCRSLTNITIPESITNIEHSAFYGCSSLSDIQIPESVTSIRWNTFSGCSSLTNITIPESITSIEHSAFYGCSSLTNITIPESVTSIESSAFRGCSNLTNITIPENVTSIESDTFSGCSSLTNITIPESVTNIGHYAIPDTTLIYAKADSEAHRYAEESKQGYILEGNVTNLTTDYEIKEEKTWDISKNQDKSIIAKWTEKNKTLVISGKGEMKDWSFRTNEDWNNNQYTKFIEQVDIRSEVINIGDFAFNDCSSLKNITIPKSVTSIGAFAFDDCSSLTNITIPESVTRIKLYTFFGCRSLTNITIPENVTRIESTAFRGCRSLTNITIPENVTRIESETFSDCSSLTNITIPENVISIDKSAFSSCRSLVNITIPGSVTSIDEYAFSGCSSLSDIQIPESVTTIKEKAFEGCSSLESIKVSEKNTVYGSEEGILFNKEKTKIIKCPEGKKEINRYEVPKSVIEIEGYAFDGCNNLTGIIIPNSTTNIEPNAIPETILIYTKTNSEAHRYAEEGKQRYILDEKAPKIIYETNGSSIVSKKQGTKVAVIDEETGINENQLMYKWTQSTAQPLEEEFTEKFNNEQIIEKNSGDGEWYLWILAKDKLDNTKITRSESFLLDNTAPTVNVSYSTTNLTNQNVTVTVTANEAVQAVEGWNLSFDKLKLSKQYSQNTTEEIIIKDLAGNETKAKIEITNIKHIQKGDINNDEKINTSDLLKMLRHISTSKSQEIANKNPSWILVENEKEAADINSDGKVDTTDLLKLLRHIAASKNEETAKKHPNWIL